MKRYRIQVSLAKEEYDILKKHSELTGVPLGKIITNYFRDGEIYKVFDNANSLLQSLQELEKKGKFENLSDDDVATLLVRDLSKNTRFSALFK